MRLASKGMFGSLQLEGEKFAVDSATKDLELKTKQLQTLDNYKKKKTMQQLQSALNAARARLAAEVASLQLEKDRLQRDKEQLENCVIKAPAGGMVIFPSAAEWKETPDIEEGARVREQQTLLMIPDLDKMQVKVGVHESKVGRLSAGMPATVELQDVTLKGEVDSIAEVTRPAGWWTGNMVKYDTVIRLQPQAGLKPGMSAVVDITLAEYTDVLKIPVAAIVGSNEGFLCWVKMEQGVHRRVIELGDSNDEFTVVSAGLAEGEEVVLNPAAFLDEAELEAMRPRNETDAEDKEAGAANKKGVPADKPNMKPASQKTGPGGGAKIIAAADQNGDGVLTETEFPEKDRANFASIDTNGDGKVIAAELDAAIKAAQSE
jgi:RND family efflux transporter MFP subunit